MGRALEPVEGYVWCTVLTEVHEDSLNPYGYDPDNWCRPEDHRRLVWRTRKNDIERSG